MKSPRPARLATGWTPYRGLLPPDRPGRVLLVLDRNPHAGHLGAASILLFFVCCLWCGFGLSVFFAFAQPSAGILGLSAVLLGASLLPTFGLVRNLLSREQLWLYDRGLVYRSIDGLVRRRRMIPYPEIRRITRYEVMVVHGDGQTFHPEYGLAIETYGRTLCAGQCRDPEEVDQLLEEVLRNVREWDPAWVAAPEPPEFEVLDASGMRTDPPLDSAMSCRREWDRTGFVLCNPAGRFDARCDGPLIGVLLCATLLLVLLLPFTKPLSIGVLVVGWFGLTLLLVSDRRRWVLRPGEVHTSILGLEFLWSRTTEIEWLYRIELRRIPSDRRWAPAFQLALVDPDGEDKVVFGPLSEGEARWMAGIVAEVFRDALPRPGQEVYRWSVSADQPAVGSKAMADPWLDDPGSKGLA